MTTSTIAAIAASRRESVGFELVGATRAQPPLGVRVGVECVAEIHAEHHEVFHGVVQGVWLNAVDGSRAGTAAPSSPSARCPIGAGCELGDRRELRCAVGQGGDVFAVAA